jgi:hypothetical protein
MFTKINCTDDTFAPICIFVYALPTVVSLMLNFETLFNTQRENNRQYQEASTATHSEASDPIVV